MMTTNANKLKTPRCGDPVYLLFRYGKLVFTGSNAARLFFSEAHFKFHKKRYGGCFLETDELVKYVPERRGEWEVHSDEYEICASEFVCSNCKKSFVSSELTDEQFFEMMKHCPNCGADMRGVKDE